MRTLVVASSVLSSTTCLGEIRFPPAYHTPHRRGCPGRRDPRSPVVLPRGTTGRRSDLAACSVTTAPPSRAQTIANLSGGLTNKNTRTRVHQRTVDLVAQDALSSDGASGI